jgi:hypothetical protein
VDGSTALSNLSSKRRLKSQIESAITGAINSISSTINTKIDDIVDEIVSKLGATLDQALGDVTSFVTTQIQAATANVSSGVDTAIDAVIDPIVGKAPTALQPVVSLLLQPLKDLIGDAVKDALKDALNGSVDKIAAATSTALHSGLDALGDQVKHQVKAILQPMIDRLTVQLTQLVGTVEARIAPVLDRLHSITNIQFGAGLATMDHVEVDVTAIGISNAKAFIGIPPDVNAPAGGLHFHLPAAQQTAIGLFINNFNLALGLFKPVAGPQLPNFTAAKITADTAAFVDGGAGILQVIAQGINVQLNLGGKIGNLPLAENATIDFVKSFPPEPNTGDLAADDLDHDGKRDPAGFEVKTGANSSVYLDFQGELIRASVASATIKISQFVYITGSLAFEKGTIQTVDVTAGAT